MQKNGWALLPVGVFLFAFVGSGILFGSFQAIPAVIAFLLALTVAFFQKPKRPFEQKLDDVTRGMGDDSVMLMCLIFLLAGGFTGAAQAAGCVDSTVGFFLTILPPAVSVGGIFLIGCLISTAMGTSIGTIAALTPVAAGISQKTGISGALCIGAVLSGAMFGDNLSMISDTTIAATRALGCSTRDKFRENLKIVFPGAVIALFLYLGTVKTGQPAIGQLAGDYNLSHLLPYLAVLSCSLAGLSVIPVLIFGIVLCCVVGVATGEIAPSDILAVLFSGPDENSGIQSMYDMMAVSMVVAGVIGLVRANGGIDYLLEKIRHRVRSPRPLSSELRPLRQP